MIIVYDKNETDFSKNGLRVIDNILKSAYVTQYLNGEYALDIEATLDKQEKYKCLEGLNIIKVEDQLFRIPFIANTQDTSFTRKITAKHIFYDLLNDFNDDTRAVNKSVHEALQIATAVNSKFTVIQCDDLGLNTAYYIEESPVTSIFDKIINRWGGELYRDNYNVAIKSRLGKDTGILISYAKNITGFEQTLDWTSLATKILLKGKDGLTIDLVNGGSKYLISPRVNDYPFVITKKVEFTDIEDATELKNKGLSLWGTIDIPIANYKVNFLELSKTEEYKKLKVLQELSLGDTVIIRHKIFNVDLLARVIKIKKNILTGKIEEIELGQFRPNLANKFKSINSKINYSQSLLTDTRLDLEGTKTRVFQNDEQIALGATNVDYTQTTAQNSRFFLNSKAIVVDPSDSYYANCGFPNPPVGGVFHELDINGNVAGYIDTPSACWALINLLKIYDENNTDYVLSKAKLIGDFLVSNMISISLWGAIGKIMPNSYNYAAGSWSAATSVVHVRTQYHTLWALLELYKRTKSDNYKNAAIDLMKLCGNVYNNVSKRATSEISSWMLGAVYNTFNAGTYDSNGNLNYTFSWTDFAVSTADVLSQAVPLYIEQIGDDTMTDVEGTSFKPSSISTDFKTWLQFCYDNQGLTMAITNLPYSFYHYDWADALVDGRYVPKPMNFDWINMIWGNVWFVGDLTMWILNGMARLGLTTIATTYRTYYYALKVASSNNYVIFHDRYNYDGTALIDDTTTAICNTALLIQLDSLINRTVDDNAMKTLEDYQATSKDKNIDGCYQWDTTIASSVYEIKTLGEIAYAPITFKGALKRIKDAELKITDEAIVATVTSSTSYTSTIGTIDDRLNSAEQKITATAIVSTVRTSTEYVTDLGQKVTADQASSIAQTANNVKIGFNGIDNNIVMSDQGLDINNGHLQVKNNNNAVTIDGNFLMLKILAYGNGSISCASGESAKTVTIPHSLGFAPIFMGQFLDSGGSAHPDPYILYDWNLSGSYHAVDVVCHMAADANNLYIYVQRSNAHVNSGSFTVYYRYFIYKDAAI